jgi:NADP-reducing hydrogenase subunit HndA
MSNCQGKQECDTQQGYDLPEHLFRELDTFIDGLPTMEGHLVTVLHKAQSLFGFLPEQIQQYVADRMNIPVVHVYGVVSFYTFFTMKPKGKHPIAICMGTACFVKGANKVVDAFMQQLQIEVGEVSSDGLFSIDCLRCVGACALAPIVLVGEKVYGNVTTDQVKDIIADFA